MEDGINVVLRYLGSYCFLREKEDGVKVFFVSGFVFLRCSIELADSLRYFEGVFCKFLILFI